jgi:hypothetical protein
LRFAFFHLFPVSITWHGGLTDVVAALCLRRYRALFLFEKDGAGHFPGLAKIIPCASPRHARDAGKKLNFDFSALNAADY